MHICNNYQGSSLNILKFWIDFHNIPLSLFIASKWGGCPDAYCDENNILRGAKPQTHLIKHEGPFKDASDAEKSQRRWFGVDTRYKKIATEKSN